MSIFETNKGEVTLYRVVKSVGGLQFSLDEAEVLEITGAIPREIQAFEARGLVQRMPPLPAELRPWFEMGLRFRPVSAKTFTPRPEPPEPVFLDKPAVLRRMHWTDEQLQSAIVRVNFPKHNHTRDRFEENKGYVPVAWFWSEAAIDQWEKNMPRDLLGGASH
jgi:hypothetical protein